MLGVDGLEVLTAGDVLVAILASHQGVLAGDLRAERPFAYAVIGEQVDGYRFSQQLCIPNVIEVKRRQQIQKWRKNLRFLLVVIAVARIEVWNMK